MLYPYLHFIILYLVIRVVRSSLWTLYDPASNMVIIEENGHDPESAYDVDLDAIVTATCVFENLVALDLTADNRPYRSRDCAAIQHFGFEIAQRWTSEDLTDDSQYFKYVEIGSNSGLESYAIVSALQELDIPIVAYVHQNFSTEIMRNDTSTVDYSDLKSFYRRIQSFQMERKIIPINGLPLRTLNMHDSSSVDMVYLGTLVNTYEDTLEQLREGWRILKPGGVLVGIHAYPAELALNRVESALLQFCFEQGMVLHGGSYYAWKLVQSTSFIYFIWKELPS